MSGPIFRDVTRAEEVRLEAQRCGGCQRECMSGCPVGIDIPKTMELLKDGYFEEAGKLWTEQNPFASTCGRMCLAACQKRCPQNINIKGIERWLGDQYSAPVVKGKRNKRKAAVVGAGLAGLTASESLIRRGYEVTLYEATEKAGGFVRHFISSRRFPTKIKERDVARVQEHTNFRPQTIVGATPKLQELAASFDVVLLATGANKPMVLQVPGEHLHHVYSAADFLRGATPSTKGRTVVIGGGQVALDCARISAKKGDDVTLIDRHNQQALSVEPEMLTSAQEEGVQFMLMTQPVRFLGDKKVEGIECMQMMVTQSDFDDSFITVPIEDSHFTLSCDRVIVAVGFEPNPSISNTHQDLRTVGKGRIWTDEYARTTIPGVFACGEIVLGSTSPDRTIAHAREVVERIDHLLNTPDDPMPEEIKNGQGTIL